MVSRRSWSVLRQAEVVGRTSVGYNFGYYCGSGVFVLALAAVGLIPVTEP